MDRVFFNVVKNNILVATLPKAGTWYMSVFFWCYEQLLQNSNDYLKGNFVPDLEGVIRDRKLTTLLAI